MHLLLLRHGQTDENARGILQGQSQTRLNALGHEQAAALAGRLTTFTPRVQALVTSDLMRARETAGAIERALGLEAAADPAWRERGFGQFEGRTIGAAEIWRAAAGSWDLPGAEPTGAFHARVHDALLRVVGDCAAFTCVGVVTHGAVIRTVLTLLGDGRLTMAAGEAAPLSVPIANCSILHLRVDPVDRPPPAWRVACVNDVAHLTLDPLPAFRVEE